MKKKNKITGMPLMMALLFCSVSAMPFSLGLAGGSLNPLDRMNAVFEAWTTVAGVFVTPYHPINSFDWSRFIDDAAAEPAAPANTMGDESSVVASLTDSEWTDIHSPLAGISQTVPAGKAVCKAERAIRRNVKPVVLQNMAVNVNAEYEIKVNVVPAVDRVLATLRVPVMKFRNEIRQRNAIDYERLKVKLVTLEAKADNLSSAELAELVRAVKRRSKSKPPSPTFTCDGNAYFVPSGNTEAFEREVRVKMSERTPLGSEGPRL